MIVLVFGSMSLLAFRQRDQDEVNAVIPAVGTVGAPDFFPLMLYILSPFMFGIVLALTE